MRQVSRAWASLLAIAFLGIGSAGCNRGAPSTDSNAPCLEARATARAAWDAVLPPMRTAAEEAQKAASNCHGPTRDQPPCSGQMSERFVVQSVTAAKLLEVERARDATVDAGALDLREAARLVRDDPKVQSAKAASDAAFEACKVVSP